MLLGRWDGAVLPVVVMASCVITSCGGRAERGTAAGNGGSSGQDTGDPSTANQTTTSAASDSPPAASDGVASPLDSALPKPLVGWFNAQLVDPRASTQSPYLALLGTVYSSAQPHASFDARTVEGCVVAPWTARCEEECTQLTVCTYAGSCEPYPSTVSVGAVTVRGFRSLDGQPSLSLEQATQNAIHYFAGTAGLEFPPCAEGDPLRLDAEGEYYAAFSIDNSCVAALELTNTEPLLVERDRALEVSWTPPAGAGTSRMLLELQLTRGGGPAEEIYCNVPDTGQATIPAGLVTELMDYGVHGFPSLRLTRNSDGYAEVSGGFVRFSISSSAEVAVEVPDLVSCIDSDDCGDEQRCDAFEERCVPCEPCLPCESCRLQ